VDLGEVVVADDDVADEAVPESSLVMPASALNGVRRELLEIRELLSLHV
jgi:hypothetical protein